VIYSTFGTLTWSKKKYYFGSEKGVKKPSGPKTEFGVGNQDGHVI
jgi:hypothetical protein